MLLAYLFPRWRWPLMLVPWFIATARVNANDHFISDVAASINRAIPQLLASEPCEKASRLCPDPSRGGQWCDILSKCFDVDCRPGCGSCLPDPSSSTGCTKTCFNAACEESYIPCQGCCPPGFTRCGAQCVNRINDPRNCGGCGNVCPSSICTNGSCAPCPAELTPCGGMWIDLNKNRLNCGSCGNTCTQCCYNGTCGVNTTCSDGSTGCCPTGFPFCENVMGDNQCWHLDR
jgi:hypothetical protein